MDLRNLEYSLFYYVYSRLPRNGVGGVHVFHECLPTSSTKTYPKVTTFRKGRRDGHCYGCYTPANGCYSGCYSSLRPIAQSPRQESRVHPGSPSMSQAWRNAANIGKRMGQTLQVRCKLTSTLGSTSHFDCALPKWEACSKTHMRKA